MILENLRQKGKITDLKLQQHFPLRSHSNEVIGKYVADFLVTFRDGSQLVVEAKGRETPVWKWKEKHFRQDYSIPLLVIKRQDINELLFLGS